MTKPMANPTPRALKRRNVEPTPITRDRKKRGASAAPRIAEARAAKKSTNSAASASEIDPDKPLTEKQRQFVKFWAEGDTIPNATLRAGFSDDGLGYRLARAPNILALKAKYEAEWQETRQMTREKVMDGMLESIEMAKLMAEPSSMIAGWREIGKICGFYAPVETRVKVDVTGNIALDRLNSMSDAELLKIITIGTQQALPYVQDTDAS